MKKNKYYILESGRGLKNSRSLYYIFGGIVVFLIIFPFIAVNLRFQTGYIFSKTFDFIGRLCMMGGGFLTAYSILSIFIGRRSLNLKMLTTGIIFLWIGCWLTGDVLNILGITLGNDHTSPGYH
jgi:hypothetical protein